jgi:hypothetical protein
MDRFVRVQKAGRWGNEPSVSRENTKLAQNQGYKRDGVAHDMLKSPRRAVDVESITLGVEEEIIPLHLYKVLYLSHFGKVQLKHHYLMYS